MSSAGVGGGACRPLPGGATLRIRITSEETRHIIEAALCACRRAAEAPNDMPARDNFGRRLVALDPGIRAGRVPLGRIVRAMGFTAGVRMAESTVNNIMTRAPDAMRPEAVGMLRRVGRSPTAGFNETHWSGDGSTAYANMAQPGGGGTVSR